MVEQLITDAKFDLCAILLLIAITAPANTGTNVEVPDYVVISAVCPKSQELQSGWFKIESNLRPEVIASVLMEYPPVVQEDEAVCMAVVAIWPAPSARWTLTSHVPLTSLTIATRAGPIVRNNVAATDVIQFTTQ
jgi:hypothetical protein